MARQSTKGDAKAPRGKKTAPAAAPAVPAPVDGAETGPEALEATASAAGALLPEGTIEAAAQQEVSDGEPEAGSDLRENALPEARAAPEELSTPEGRRAVVCSPKGLNLRAGPALNYDALEVLADGAEVTVLALPRGVTVPGWELVMAGERAGWCSARFLRPLED